MPNTPESSPYPQFPDDTRNPDGIEENPEDQESPSKESSNGRVTEQEQDPPMILPAREVSESSERHLVSSDATFPVENIPFIGEFKKHIERSQKSFLQEGLGRPLYESLDTMARLYNIESEDCVSIARNLGNT